MHDELCSCGSGRTFARCHGDPANEFARRQALAEARQLAFLFPSVRLRDADELADRLALDMADAEEIGDEQLAAAAREVSAGEARRLVDSWSTVYSDRWASLCHAANDLAAAERGVVEGALAAAVHERLSTPHELLAELELAQPPPAGALAFVVPAPFLWSCDEARAAAAAEPERVKDVAAALGRIEHVERLQRLARFVRRELPFPACPKTSERLAEACRLVETDLAFARAVMAFSLLAYAQQLESSYITSRN